MMSTVIVLLFRKKIKMKKKKSVKTINYKKNWKKNKEMLLINHLTDLFYY
jgi:hypothetical protein